jgi:hypothetical protein
MITAASAAGAAGRKRMTISLPTVCTVLGVIGSVAGLYTDMRITTAAHGARIEAHRPRAGARA